MAATISRAALAAAHALAVDRDAELVVLSVATDVPVLAAGDVGYAMVVADPAPRAAARAELDAAVAELSGTVPVRGELLEGHPGHELVERAARLDLLVAGSKGHGAVGRVVLGSMSHHLMCNSPVPVVVVAAQ